MHHQTRHTWGFLAKRTTENVTALTSCCGTGRITLHGGIWHLLLLLLIVDFCEKIV